MSFVIKLVDIPKGLLPLINDSPEGGYERPYLDGIKIKEISVSEEQYSIITVKAEHRVPLDTGITIEIR